MLPAVFDPREAIKPGAPAVNEYAQRFFYYDENMNEVYEKPEKDVYPNLIFHYKCRKGDPELAWKKCAAIAEGTFFSPFVDHAFLQPESGIAYRREDGKLVLTASSQYMHFDRLEVSDATGIPEEDIVIINPAVGCWRQRGYHSADPYRLGGHSYRKTCENDLWPGGDRFPIPLQTSPHIHDMQDGSRCRGQAAGIRGRALR